MKSVIVGTAGHIDHGKSALVRALTGTDPDRLSEEKRRGITIDLGFAHLDLTSDLLPNNAGELLRLGFVDVPGHERFVRNMLAGVGGIDVVLLVIAADEGVMPQTREHFDICRLLSVHRGLTVLTKSDLVDAETLEVVKLEVEEFLRGSFLDPSQAPILSISSKTGEGIAALKRELARIAAELPERDAKAIFRLPIDRVFTMKGFGTVVTGTLIAGSVREEDEVEVLPARRRLRVRGVQVHGAKSRQASAGQRTAVNLASVAPEDLARGMMLVPPQTVSATRRIDVRLSLLASARPLKNRARVHLHAYSAETVAQVALFEGDSLAPGSDGYVQLRLAQPTALLPGDRFIVRQFSPVVTIGGGVVLDAMAPLKRGSSVERLRFLDTLATGDAAQLLRARIERSAARGLSFQDALAETGWPLAEVRRVAQQLISNQNVLSFGDLLLSCEAAEHAKKEIVANVRAFHDQNKLVAGVGKEELRDRVQLSPEVFASLLAQLVATRQLAVDSELIHLPGRGVALRDDEAEAKQKIESAFRAAGLKVPALKEVLAALPLDKARSQKLVTLLLRDRALIKVSEDLVFHREALEAMRKQVAELKATSTKIDVSQFKDMTGISRKYAIPLLEYLDREHVTKRVGDARVIL